ncbi:hypothetical protein BDW22DRAFT_1050533 [Trametopsis cervina]|nr:hypothetical protein BDW22DRAFT_1050533 [Trametopsis cervina]
MLFKSVLPYLFLAASSNAAVLPVRRADELFTRDLLDILSGVANAVEGLLQDLPSDVSAPIASVVDGLLGGSATADDTSATATTVVTDDGGSATATVTSGAVDPTDAPTNDDPTDTSTSDPLDVSTSDDSTDDMELLG